MSDIVQLITAVTALTAVIISPVGAIYIARKQIRASVISTNRQVWINSLRNTIADYLAKQAIVRNLNRLQHADGDSLSRIEDTVRLAGQIELLMNPNESDHAELVKLVCDMTNSLNAQDEANKNFDVEHRERVVTLSQAILKREWNRVKRGD